MTDELLCFASGRPGEWEAICLDYDIVVQGRSFDDVQHLVRLSIDDYIESARQESPEIRDKLLNRRVPRRVWLGYISTMPNTVWTSPTLGASLKRPTARRS